MSIRFYEVELSEIDRNPLRGKRMNLRTIGDAFSTAPYIVKYHDMNREMLIPYSLRCNTSSSSCWPKFRPASMTPLRLTSTGRGGNFDPRASEPARAARQSSVA